MPEKRYCVYKHTFPNGRVYIGITNRNPLDRWQGGNGYKGHDEMYADILEYGWKNIRHEILDEGLNRQKAMDAEKKYIKEHEQKHRGSTYNIQNTSENLVYESFMDRPVNEISATHYKDNFLRKIDSWFDDNEYFPDGMYHDCIMNQDRLLFRTKMSMRDNKIYCTEIIFEYPQSGMKFKELRDWFYTYPKAVVNRNVRYHWD